MSNWRPPSLPHHRHRNRITPPKRRKVRGSEGWDHLAAWALPRRKLTAVVDHESLYTSPDGKSIAAILEIAVIMGSLTTNTPAKSPINLQLGWPSPRLFAASSLLDGANEVLSSEPETAKALIYGPHTGHPPLRQSVAEWLSSVFSTTVASDRISINNGASANLSNILLKFTDPSFTRKIFMIEPTYFLACPIFEDNGFQGKLRGVPENEEGLDIEFLRRELKAAESEAVEAAKKDNLPDTPRLKTGKNYSKIFKYIIYAVPTFSNPSGKTWPIHLRKELVALARQYDALVVTDDVYDFLCWPEDSSISDDTSLKIPPRLVDIDREMPGISEFGNTLSNGSFSKIIGPGIRVGWAESTPASATMLGEVGSSSSGGAPSHLTSTFVDKMLRSNALQYHIQNTLIPTYRSRYNTLISSIHTHLSPLGVTIEVATSETRISGGFFTFIRLPNDLPTARTIAAYALKEKNLRVAFGHMFVVTGDEGSLERAEKQEGFARCIRLCWAWHEEGEIREGIERLRDVIVEIRDKVKKGEVLDDGTAIGIR